MKCRLCDEELGEGDMYELLKTHAYYCDSKEGRAYAKSVDDSDGHSMYCQCERCI